MPAPRKNQVYVDLNPLRAGINPTPEESDYTSIQARIRAEQAPERAQDQSKTPVRLVDFIGNERKDQPEGIAFSFLDYRELVDWTGRAVCDDKPGAIADGLPPILARLGIEKQVWLETIIHYEQRFFRAVGTLAKIKQFAARLGQCWLKGQSAGRCVYKQPLPT